MTTDYQPVKETLDNPMRRDWDRCEVCNSYYRSGHPIPRPPKPKSWFWYYLGNLWEYRWRFEYRFTESGTIPIGYGISWYMQNSLEMVAHPIPFNVVMRTLREFGCWMMRGGWRKFPTTQDKIDHEVARRLQIAIAAITPLQNQPVTPMQKMLNDLIGKVGSGGVSEK